MVESNPFAFGEDVNSDWEQLTLCIFVFYEMSRGIESYWYPYLVSMPTVRFTCLWSHEEIKACQDSFVTMYLREYRSELRT